MKRGCLITVEGIEGCGKSTQSRLLYEYLARHDVDVILQREPGGTMVGDRIRDILLDVAHDGMDDMTEVLLYAASRAQLVMEVVAPALEQGRVVILDRYVDSTFAYQVYGRGIARHVVEDINKPAVNGYMPDLTILLDVDVNLGLSRLKMAEADRIEQEGVDFHERVRQGFLDLAKQEPARFRIIDGGQNPDIVHQEMAGLAREAVGIDV